jgi:hypothetical protein
VRLPSGRTILLRSLEDVADDDDMAGRVLDVGFRDLRLASITDTLREVGTVIKSAIEPLLPDSATVEIGLGVSGKTGQIVALFGEAAAEASIQITLNWSFGRTTAHVEA